MHIVSSTALRTDYISVSELARESREPIYITKNGEGDLVVMSIEAFEQREKVLQLRTELENSEQSRLATSSASSEESKRTLELVYDIFCLLQERLPFK